MFETASSKAKGLSVLTGYDSKTGVYMQPMTADIVFGVGAAYELWGVRK